MTNLRASGELLAADETARTLTYRLLPYGEPGRTNLGSVRVARGVVALPDPAALVLNFQHDRDRPLARAVSLEDRDDALVATFAVAPTTAGDDLLVEARSGLRTGASVELEDVVIRHGDLLAGRLAAAGAVVSPAFPSALLVAADAGDDRGDEDEPAPDEPATVTPDPATPGDVEPDAADDDTEDETMTDTTLTAAAPAALPGASTPGPASLDSVNRLLAAVAGGNRDRELLAALSDITRTAAATQDPPAWLGEVWTGTPYERQIVPLIGSSPLTSFTSIGWKWTTAPAGAAYAGDKADVPSNLPVTTSHTQTADRWAGAHDHDRAMRDFSVPGYWESYWAAMGSSYSQWSDGIVALALKTDATVVPGVAGRSIVGDLIATALSVLPHGKATFALLGSDAIASLAAEAPALALSATLSIPDASGNVGSLPFATHSSLAPGDVIVGNRNAATFKELGGGSPIRVEALDVARGGVDTGAFGYALVDVHAPLAIARTTHTPGVAATSSARKS